MLRLFLLALLIWSTLRLAGRWLNRLLSAGGTGRVGGRGSGGGEKAGSTGPPAKAGVLCRCPTCGVHFAARAGTSRGGYCSDGCLGAAQDGPC